VAGGAAGRPPIVGEDEGPMSDPLPQAMVLTAIVITLGMTAFLLALAYRSWQLHRHDEVQDDVEDRRIARLAARDLRAVTDDDTELFTDTLDDEAAEARDETDRGAL
jgi:multicomponent Na+:H+ antiporter subunit C